MPDLVDTTPDSSDLILMSTAGAFRLATFSQFTTYLSGPTPGVFPDANDGVIMGIGGRYVSVSRAAFLAWLASPAQGSVPDANDSVIMSIGNKAVPVSISDFELGGWSTPPPPTVDTSWSPQNLVTSGDIIGWFDSRAGQGITLAAGNVASQVCKITGTVIAQTDVTKQPAWSATSLNGVAGVTGDGSNDFLAADPTAGTPLGSFPGGVFPAAWQAPNIRILAVGYQPVPAATAGTKSIGGFGSDTAFRSVARIQNIGANRIILNDGGNTLTGTVLDFTGYFAMWGRFQPTAMRSRLNGTDGTPSGTITATSTGSTRLRLFRSAVSTTSQYGPIILGHFFIVADTISDANRDRLEAWGLWEMGQQASLAVGHPWALLDPRTGVAPPPVSDQVIDDDGELIIDDDSELIVDI